MTREKWGKKMNSLRGKILSGFAIILLLLIITSLYSLFNVYRINSNVAQIVENDIERLSISEQLAFNMAEKLALIRGYVLLGDQAYKDRYLILADESDKLEQRILEIHDAPEIVELVAKIDRWDQLVTERVIPLFEGSGRDTTVITIQYQVDPIA